MNKTILFPVLIVATIVLTFSTNFTNAFEPASNEDFALEERNADEPEQFIPQALDPDAKITGEIALCYDYEGYGSLFLDLALSSDQFEPGDPLIIEGEITNEAPFPITDVTIRALLVRSLSNPVPDRASTTTLDDFIITSGLTMDANSSLSIDEIYQLPTNISSGEYSLLLYAYSNDRFDMTGLSYSELAYGQKIEFSVLGENTGTVFIDKTAITVNEQPYNTLEPITEHDARQITVASNLINPTDQQRQMRVIYKLYRWSSALEANLLDSVEVPYTINPGQNISLSYLLDDANEPIYELVITAMSEDTNLAESHQSMAHIQFATTNTLRPRLEYVGISSFPITSSTMLVTCIHNTSNNVDAGPVRVVTTATNNDGDIIGKLEYSGALFPATEAVVAPMTPKSTNVVTLNTELFDNANRLIDSLSIVYDCNQINPNLCTDNQTRIVSMFSIQQPIFIISGIVIGIIVTIALKWKIIRKTLYKKK